MLLAAKLVLGLVLLALVLVRVPLDQVLVSAERLTPTVVIITIVLYFAAHAVNAIKLKILLPTLSLWQAWRFTMIAVLYGTALPGQIAGDAVKAFRLAHAAGDIGDVTAAVGAVAVDKMIGMFALLLLTALGVGLNAGTFGNTIVAAAGMLTILAPLALLVILATPVPARLGRWGEAFAAWRSIALTPGVLTRALGLGFIFQALSIVVYALLGHTLGIVLSPTPWSMTLWAVIVGLISVILLLPITVAGLGLRDGSLVAVLGLLGQTRGPALALSLSLLALNLLGAAVGLIVDLAGRDR